MSTKLIWSTVDKKVSDLVPNVKNPRTMSPKQTEDLKRSLKKFNLVELPVVDLDNKALLDGQLLVNDLAESQLISAIKDRNMSAVMSWLKHHHPSYKTKVHIEGTVNTIQELSDEQKGLVRKALELANLTIEYDESEE